jgi:hypothetical protein
MPMAGATPKLGPSGHVDDFARRNLPPPDQWPELRRDRPEFNYPEYLNAAVELTDRIVEQGMGDRIALIGNGRLLGFTSGTTGEPKATMHFHRDRSHRGSAALNDAAGSISWIDRSNRASSLLTPRAY